MVNFCVHSLMYMVDEKKKISNKTKSCLQMHQKRCLFFFFSSMFRIVTNLLERENFPESHLAEK